MSFDKKFNIKKLVKVSAVALAMISAGGVASTVNANTNVHADSIASEQLALGTKIGARNEAQGNRYETHAEIEGDRSDPSALAEDIAYNKSFVEKHKSQLMSGLSNKTKSAVKKQVEADEGDTQPDTSSNSSDSDVKMPSIFNVSTHNSSKESTSRSKVAKVTKSSKHAHLSKAMVRKIMKQIRTDKRAIHNDRKQLSSCKARKFVRDYTKTAKSIKRTKLIQKHAMTIKGAKRYVRYYKDEIRHEKDLTRLTKRINKKYVRKSRKQVKRSHKVTRHHRKIRK